METHEPDQTSQEPSQAPLTSEAPPSTESAPEAPETVAPEPVAALPQDLGLPVGVVVGGQTRVLSEPDLSGPELEPAGGDHSELAYDKHSDTATTADGETVRITVAHPVRVDGTNRRSDDDALEGGKVKIVDGPYKDRKGVFLSVERYNPQDGYPAQVIVRTSDDEHELLSVPYGSLRPDLSQR